MLKGKIPAKKKDRRIPENQYTKPEMAKNLSELRQK